jgi:heme-degrading monooxygenase HmoA
MSPHSNSVLEVAVFTVRSPVDFLEVQRRTHEALSTLPGHRDSARLRGCKEGLFADLVAWESIEAAERASALVREDPRFAPLMASIEGLRLYAHYALAVDPADVLRELRRAQRVEVAAYGVHAVAAHAEAHPRLYEALRSQRGFRGGAPARQIEDGEQFADVIGWESEEAHERAGATLQTMPELAGFFSGIGETAVFELFTVVP